MTLEQALTKFDGCRRVREWVAYHKVDLQADLSVAEIVEITVAKGDVFWCRTIRDNFRLTNAQKSRCGP
jgi:hypothetical protein